MRTIDADRLLEEKRMHTYYHLPNGDVAIPLIDIKNAPTVAVDRPTGKWELIESEHVENIYLCTHCRNYEAWGETEKTPYCPQCGSYNGGGQSEND
jgi:hypothetical protein